MAKSNIGVPRSVGNRYTCLRSTMVVQVHRKHQVVGSSPIGGLERERVSVTYVIRDEE